MIGERHAAQLREPSWQRTLQSLSLCLFRFAASRSPVRVSMELRALSLSGNGNRTCRFAKREVEIRTRIRYPRPNYPGGSRARLQGLVAAALLHQRLDLRPLLVPSPLHSIYYSYFRHRACFRSPWKILILVCYSFAPDLILYLLHLYLHNPISRCDLGHVTYTVQRHMLEAFSPALEMAQSYADRNICRGYVLSGRTLGCRPTPPEDFGAEEVQLRRGIQLPSKLV